MDQAQQLRNIIKQQNRQKHLARVITVTSGKGGVGKSNVSVNLAIQLSRIGKRVIIIDADFGLANIEVMLGARPRYTLADLMFRGKSVREVIAKGPENIGFISGGSGIRELTNLNSDQVQSILNMFYELDELADIVIIDTGAGISSTVIDMILSSSEVLLVATPEPTSITDAYALLKTLRRNSDFNTSDIKVRLVANRTQNRNEGYELYRKLNAGTNKFLKLEIDYLGSIPFDGSIQKAVMKQKPVTVCMPGAPSTKAFMELAMILENGGHIRQTTRQSGIAEFFNKMLRSHM